jgi:lipopolysaccharide export system permease protein
MIGRIDGYIFRTCFGAFTLILATLTLLIWVTQALRDVDLVTTQGQTVLSFIAITGLIIPLLVLVIAPVAHMIAVAYALNKLNSDSEIVVMSASGMSPWRTFRPFVAVTLVVMLLVGFVSAYLAPKGLRMLNEWVTKVKTDLLTNLVQPGRFMPIEGKLTFHIRERRPNGQLMGVFIDDQRNASERATFLAEYGEVIENERGAFLVLVNGSVQRQRASERDPTIVLFDRYAFDLSKFTTSSMVTTVGVRERYLWELANPDPQDPLYHSQPGQFRAELHDRIVAPLYPLAFTVIAFAGLGAPRTTRQSRAFSLGLAILGVAGLRFAGFACVVVAPRTGLAVVFLYGLLVAAFGFGLTVIGRGMIIEPPTFVTKTIAQLTERASRMLAPG